MEAVRGEAAATDETATRREGEISVVENDIRHDREQIERLRGEIAENTRSEAELRAEIEQKQAAVQAKRGGARRAHLISLPLPRSLRHCAPERTARRRRSTRFRRRSQRSMRRWRKCACAARRRNPHSMRSARGAIRWTPRSRRAAHRANRSGRGGNAARNGGGHAGEDSGGGKRRAGLCAAAGEQAEKGRGRKGEADKLLLDANEQARRAKLLEDLERNSRASRRASKPSCASGSAAICGAVHGPVTRLLHVPREYAVAL